MGMRRLEALFREGEVPDATAADPLLVAPSEVHVASAVAVVFRPGGELLFIRRADRVGDPWSGHMAFPGGKAEPGDESLRHTAEREALEEVGLALGRGGRFLGRLPSLVTPLRIAGRRHRVTPFVYTLDDHPSLLPNAEVASVHWFHLDRLVRGEGRGTMRYPFGGAEVELPVVELEGTRIWGLTLRMVDDLLERLAEGRSGSK